MSVRSDLKIRHDGRTRGQKKELGLLGRLGLDVTVHVGRCDHEKAQGRPADDRECCTVTLSNNKVAELDGELGEGLELEGRSGRAVHEQEHGREVEG